jgi:hypothetical protein
MRNYILFYIIFTTAVVAAAVCYRQHNDKKQFITMASLNAMSLSSTKIFEHSNNRNFNEIQQYAKAYPRFKAINMSIQYAEENWKAYDAYLTNFMRENKIQDGNTDENTAQTYTKWSAGKMSEYRITRQNLKQYYTDSLFSDILFYKNPKEFVYLTDGHEKAMAVFFENNQKYTAAEQYRWLNADKLYWRLTLKRLLAGVAEDLKDRYNQIEIVNDKSRNFRIVMDAERSVFNSKQTFIALFSLVPLLNNDKALGFVVNGRSVKSKNGQAFFSFPSGKASGADGAIGASATFTNLETGGSMSCSDTIKYKVGR